MQTKLQLEMNQNFHLKYQLFEFNPSYTVKPV